MNGCALSRRKFLRGNSRPDSLLRPPWAINETDFTEVCTRCLACLHACPSSLIIKGSAGYPEISFSQQGCDYCQACVESCDDGALSLDTATSQLAWQQQASIDEKCFAKNGIVCRSCGEICESRAIRFKHALAGRSQITLDTGLCNGCGECVHVCPAQSIAIKNTSEINHV